MDTPPLSAKAIWKEGLPRLDKIWTDGVQELNATIEDMQEDEPIDVSSTVAREKARHLDFMLKELVSKIDNVRLDIRASGPRLTLCDIPHEVMISTMDTPALFAKTIWKEGLRRWNKIWTDGVQELNATIEDMQEDEPMGESSTEAREKARRLDFLLKELASKIDDVRLDIDNVRLDIRASGPKLTLCEIPDEVMISTMDTPPLSAKAIWKEGLPRLDKIWTDGVQELNATIEDMQEDIPMGESSTVAREKARHLYFMLKELASKIDSARLDIRASGPKLTLCEIPDEVILEILQLVCTTVMRFDLTFTNFRFIVKMSLVCKQFRRIVLSSSNLWAGCELTLHMPPHIIDMVVSRSGSYGLAVGLYDGYPERQPRELPISSLTKLFEHRSRWRELRFELSYESSQLILAHFPNEDLSTLVSLETPHYSEIYIYRRPLCIYQDWMLPSLRILDEWAWLPPLSFASRVPNLIKCCLESTPSEFSKLFGFLNAIPRLEELRLKIFDEKTLVQSTTLHLPALKTLNLRFIPEFGPGALVEHTLRLFSCPEVKQFSFHLHNLDRGDETSITSGWKRGLLSLRSLCPCLESFSLSVRGYMTQTKMYFIDDILQNLPRTIENIRLDIKFDRFGSHYHDSLPQASKSTHPCLTSLIIIQHEDSKYVEKDFFTQVAAQLKLRNIRLKKLSHIRQRKEVKETRNIFREAGVLYDENVPQ